MNSKALKKSRQFESCREAGKQAFGSKDYSAAVDKYTEALAIDPENEQMQVLLRSNRALALNAVRRYSSLRWFTLKWSSINSSRDMMK